MYKFLKNDQKQEATLVPWNSKPKTFDEDVQVPIRATVLSILLILIFIVVISMVHFTTQSGSSESSTFQAAISLQIICCSLLPTLIIVFTVKQHKAKKNVEKAVQPPQTLQFHSDEQSDEERNDTENHI